MEDCLSKEELKNLDAFKVIHPIDRIYEMDYLDGDRVGQIANFELVGRIVRVQIVEISRGKTRFKRIEKMTFE